MAKETGEWIMYGLEWDDPLRIRSWRELINWINEIGFLPLFKRKSIRRYTGSDKNNRRVNLNGGKL